MQNGTTMNHQAQVRRMLVDMFEHQALQLASLAAEGSLSDAVTWQLIRVLEASHRRAARRLQSVNCKPVGRPGKAASAMHPAISEFLVRLRAGYPQDEIPA